jgi:hypothetical protein
MKLCITLSALILCTLPGSALAKIVISEFLARNETGLKDEDSQLSDWIEIVNTGVEFVSLDGWTLTDNLDRPRKWKFPAVDLAAGVHRLIFATGKDRRPADGEWHSNFRLSAVGETLAVFPPESDTASHSIAAAPQFDDISYGIDDTTGHVGYLKKVTPNESNGSLVYPGPVISEVTHGPDPLLPGDDVVVTARVMPRDDDAAVQSVTLSVRVGFSAEGNGLSMKDDGTGEDATAGDGVYTAVISGRTLFGPRIKPGEMVRWAVTATDKRNDGSRLPAFLDQTGVEQSPEYFGAVTQNAGFETPLSLFEWFSDDVRNARSRRGARAAVQFNDTFYDNIFVRQRGGATNGQSQKFNFSNAFPCFVNEDLPAVGELNLNAQGGDTTFLRQPLAFESYTWAGNAACHSFLTTMRLNTEQDRTGVLIEQVDEDFLERHGFDPLGDLYKMVQRSNLQPVFADTTTGIEKKTGDQSDLSTIASLVAGLDLEGDALKTFLFDSINLPQVFNYLAVRSITLDADDVRKNFYVYQDTLGNGEWSIFPWDKDWTFGVTGDGGQHLRHPFFGDQAHRKDNANQWNKLYEAIFNTTATKELYLRRLRSLMDTMLQPEGTLETELRFEARVDELFAQAEGEISSAGPNTVKRFFPDRRRDLYETYDSLIPESQEAMPTIAIGDIEFQPESGNQDEEYIQLVNPNRTPIDLSGWSLDGAVKLTFAEGTVIGEGSLFNPGLNCLYVSPDVNAFRARSSSPKGGEGHFVQGDYLGHLSNRGETIVLLDRAGNVIANQAYEGNPSEVERYLILSEILYHPADPNGGAEFLELYNTSDSVELDLTGLRFTDGVDFAFADGTKLGPNAYLVIVRDTEAFQSAFGAEIAIAGEFANQSRLNNSGERLKLDTALNGTVFEVHYNVKDPWPIDVAGIVLADLAEGIDLELAESWSASLGSPGEAGIAAPDRKDFQDADKDGLVALLEKAFGTSDLDAIEGPDAFQVAEENDQLVIRARLGTNEEFSVTLQLSNDLESWENANQSFNRSDETVAGQRSAIWTSTVPVGDVGFEALRISVSR